MSSRSLATFHPVEFLKLQWLPRNELLHDDYVVDHFQSCLLCLFQCKCCVFNHLLFQYLNILWFQVGVEVASFPKLSKNEQKTNTTMMMNWINNIPPGNPIQRIPVNWSVCVSHWGNNGDFCLSLVASNPRPCLPVGAKEMEGRGRLKCFVFHSPCSLVSGPRRDHLPSQLKGMFMLHICLCSQMIFVIKLRLSGISRIPVWWHCALLFWACGCFPWKMQLAQTTVAVFWCVCGMKWRIEWVLPMFSLPQLRADPLCAGERTRWRSSLCRLLWDNDCEDKAAVFHPWKQSHP